MTELLTGPQAKARNKAWSYSRVATYETCPRKYKLQNLDKLPVEPNEAMQRGITIHKALEDFVEGRSETLPPDIEHVRRFVQDVRDLGGRAEQKWSFDQHWRPTRDYFGRDVWLRAIPDVVNVWDGRELTAEIIDWKTGKKRDTYVSQLSLFATAAFAAMPEVDVVHARLIYVDEKDCEKASVRQPYHRSSFASMREQWDERVRPFFNDDIFAPRPSYSCRWCDFNRHNGGPCEYG